MLLTKETLASAIPQHETVVQVAKAFGVTKNRIYGLVRQWGLSLDELKERDVISPTPEEIASRSAEVRATWSAAETRRRNVYGSSTRHWRVPNYKPGDLVSVSRRWSS